MRIKLLQCDKVVASADCIEGINFSVLSHRASWKVVADSGGRDVIIAQVDWIEADSYVINTRGEPWHGSIGCHSHIVPAVRQRLLQLFQRELLPGRLTVVTPILT